MHVQVVSPVMPVIYSQTKSLDPYQSRSLLPNLSFDAESVDVEKQVRQTKCSGESDPVQRWVTLDVIYRYRHTYTG